MNTPTIFNKYLRLIVTCLLLVGLSACAFPTKQKPAPSAAPIETQAETEPSLEPVVEPEKAAAMTDNSAEKHSVIHMRKGHPRQYTVKKGDTLWDISSQFLRDPWYWPEIWHKNRQVQNPHLIFPGDVLTLLYINGQPQIAVESTPQQKKTFTSRTVTTPERALRVVKLSPTIRKQGLDASVITIPGDAIRQFLSKPRIVTKEEIDSAPYILASDDNHLIMGQDNTVYIRGELDKERVRFTVFRPGEELINPVTEEVLGFEAIYAGEVRIKEYGDPAIGELTFTEREVLLGDRLLPVDKSKIRNIYYPRTPDHDVKGQVISLSDALFGIAKFQIAVINRGNRNGLEVGHLLETLSAGGTVRDRFSLRSSGEIKLPDKRSGLMMIFRVFDKVSYGLILKSTLIINNYDIVVTPR